MTNPRLLQTKLSVPPVPAELVARPRLLTQLSEGLRRKMTLVSAPAGFGKTTLLAAWARTCGEPVAWLSLDESDNEPVRFLAYLIAALEKATGTIDIALKETQFSPPGSGVNAAFTPEDIITSLINRFAGDATSIILILDDYHTISAQPVHSVLTFLIEHLPQQLHLVIASRADPALPLARLRGRGQMNELRLSDLRFSDEEAGAFLRQAMGLDLSPADLAALANKTEGWIAGLQMAGLAMQSSSVAEGGDLSSFVRNFTGSNRFILDYLVEEVLLRQPAYIQDFLLKTSILEQLNGPLCDFLFTDTGQTDPQRSQRVLQDSQAILEYLEHVNLFIVPLDNRREWYRYHRLFADLLRKRLNQTFPELVPSLHRRASEWFEENGALDEAVEHALSANDEKRAAGLVENVAEGMMMRSEFNTLQRWLDQLPDEQIATRPSLCVFHAWTLFFSNHPLEKVEERLTLIDAYDKTQSIKAAPLRAYIAAFRGLVFRAAAFARQALAGLPEEDTFLRSMAYIMLATSELSDGSLKAGYQALEQAARIGDQTGNILASVMGLASLAENYRKQGQLRKVEALYRQALSLAADSKGRRLPIAGKSLIGLGNLMREWNRLDEAERYVQEGIELIEKWGALATYTGYIALARLKRARGNLVEAEEILEKAQQLAGQTEATPLDDWVVAMAQVSLWITRGKLGLAEEWVERRVMLQKTGETHLSEDEIFAYAHMRKYELVILARLRLAQGRIDEALQQLDQLLPQIEKMDRVGLLIEIQVLRAIAFHAQGKLEEAFSALEVALSLAKPEGYIRIFLDEGEPMRRLLSEANRRETASGYVRCLLAAFEHEKTSGLIGEIQRESQSQIPFSESKEIEPLSGRELEVLHLLKSRLTVPEIADELCVAESTVRSHVKSIYGKLGVHNRMGAVQRAEELEL